MTRLRENINYFARDQLGSVAVEFALLLPVYIAFMFGIIEFGRMIWIRNSMELAVESAARYGAITSGATGASIQTQAPNYLIGVDSSMVSFSSPGCVSNVVTVTATHNFTTLISAYVPIPATTLSVTATFAC